MKTSVKPSAITVSDYITDWVEIWRTLDVIRPSTFPEMHLKINLYKSHLSIRLFNVVFLFRIDNFPGIYMIQHLPSA